MITIDPNLETVRFILTLTDKTTVENPEYTLVLYSPYTKKTYRTALGENISAYKFRYDEFILNSEIFKSMEAGAYFYSIYQTTEEQNPIEVGLLKIIGQGNERFISITPNETDDDFIVYNPN